MVVEDKNIFIALPEINKVLKPHGADFHTFVNFAKGRLIADGQVIGGAFDNRRDIDLFMFPLCMGKSVVPNGFRNVKPRIKLAQGLDIKRIAHGLNLNLWREPCQVQGRLKLMSFPLLSSLSIC